MGLLSKATTLLKEELQQTKKLSTAVINPTVVKSNITKPTTSATTIRPMVTPVATRTTTMPVSKPASIKMPTQTVVKPAVTQKPAESTKPTTARPVAQPTNSQVRPVSQTSARLASARVRNNSINLNPNRHTTGFIPVSNKPVHPKTMRKTNANAYMMANASGYGYFQGNNPRATMSQTVTNGQPMMSTNQFNGRPNPAQSSQGARPISTQQSTSRPMTMGRPATSSTITNRSSTMPRPSVNTTRRPATTMSRPLTTMTRPTTNTKPANNVRPQKKGLKQLIARKVGQNRVVARKVDTPKVFKLITAVAMTFALQLGLMNAIMTIDNTYTLPTSISLENFYNPRIEQVANNGKVAPMKKQKANKVAETQKETQQVATQKQEEKQAPKQAQQPEQKVVVANSAQNTVIEKSIQEFTQGLQFQFTQRDREVFAQMIYGEAGYGADPFEVAHVALNRLASGLFGDTLTEVITAKRQFAGFNENHPIDKNCLAIGNQAINDFIANGCKPFCKYIYFHTHKNKGLDKKYNRNVFKEGLWWEAPILPDLPGYSEEYCPTALQQAERYYAQRKLRQTEYHYTQHEVKGELELTAHDYTKLKRAVHNHTQHQKSNITEIAMNR